jgi:anion-transporting  ArsA/GET3 family ATPase
VVLTIDPARRLAQSMGLAELDNEPRQVGEVMASGGVLYAMTLDMKRTFDEIVEQHADAERARTILANPIYQSLSSSFAGTQEYMAMEKLAQLSGRIDDDDAPWDLIVVDTPPSRSALDFLDAPERIGSFLDGPLMRLVAKPARRGGRAGLRAVGAGVGVVSSVLDKILGAQLLTDVQTFITSLDAVFGNFRERADATYRMLKARDTAFIVVSAPERDPLREATYFIDRLERDAMPLAGVVLNRVHRPAVDDLSAERASAASERLVDTPSERHSDLDDHTAALLDLHREVARRYARERRMISAFNATSPTVPRVEVAALADDVHDLDGLARIGALLAQP